MFFDDVEPRRMEVKLGRAIHREDERRENMEYARKMLLELRKIAVGDGEIFFAHMVDMAATEATDRLKRLSPMAPDRQKLQAPPSEPSMRIISHRVR